MRCCRRCFGQANIHSILVARHGRLLFEHYRPGEDECWGEPLGNVAHGPNSKHDLRSVTKSVISLLLGIVLDRKLINGIDESIIDWFPQYPDLRIPEKERGIHGSTYGSCGPHIFLRISMVAWAFFGRGTRGAVGLCNGTWRAAHLRSTIARSCNCGDGGTVR